MEAFHSTVSDGGRDRRVLVGVVVLVFAVSGASSIWYGTELYLILGGAAVSIYATFGSW
jgi:hypothetical protein